MHVVSKILIGSLLVLFGSETLAQGKSASYGLIRCESRRGGENFCQADTDRGVRLSRELSRGACQAGNTYGFDREGIWVADGCSAEFEIGWHGGQSPTPGYGWGYDDDPDEGDTFVCESYNNQYEECEVGARGGVRLLQQWSRSPCIEGQTWGVERGTVWVDNGCRAEFQVQPYLGGGRPGSGHGQPGYGQPGYGQQPGYGNDLIRCESRDNRQVRCPANIGRGEVELVTQLSKSPCIEGNTYDYDQQSIWVSGGCRGDFRVVSYVQAQVVRCESKEQRRRECPVQGRSIRFSRQLSKTACIENQTWGINRFGVWVDRGCRAEFEVR